MYLMCIRTALQNDSQTSHSQTKIWKVYIKRMKSDGVKEWHQLHIIGMLSNESLHFEASY